MMIRSVVLRRRVADLAAELGFYERLTASVR